MFTICLHGAHAQVSFVCFASHAQLTQPLCSKPHPVYAASRFSFLFKVAMSNAAPTPNHKARPGAFYGYGLTISCGCPCGMDGAKQLGDSDWQNPENAQICECEFCGQGEFTGCANEINREGLGRAILVKAFYERCGIKNPTGDQIRAAPRVCEYCLDHQSRSWSPTVKKAPEPELA